MANFNSWPSGPQRVTIFKIERMDRNYALNNYVGEFEGQIVHDLKSEYLSKAVKVMTHDGVFVGYAPSDRVIEILRFIDNREAYPCKGKINRKYDPASECFYFWGECTISKSNV